MKKIPFIFIIVLILYAFNPPPSKSVEVMFYNVENLFDTINDLTVNDEEFTPEGANKWTGAKYWKKISNLEKVFYSLAAQNKSFPAVIGVSEIENRNVLEDIASTPKLLPANYQIVHYDSPERRGVDVAFFYRPDVFKLEGSKPHKTIFPSNPNYKTRDILTMWGTIDGEKFFFIVNHWPSRSGGQTVSEPRRCDAASIVRRITDSIYKQEPKIKIVIMGDLNDDPVDKSIKDVLGAKPDYTKLSQGDLFNPFFSMYKAGYGTLAYQDKWSLFDNIIVSESLVNSEENTFKIRKNNKGFHGYIHNPSFIVQQKGQYKGYPLRTFVSGNFQNGFSDHFPVYIILEK